MVCGKDSIQVTITTNTVISKSINIFIRGKNLSASWEINPKSIKQYFQFAKNMRTKYKTFWISFVIIINRFLCFSINVLVCLSVGLWPINVKTALQIGPKKSWNLTWSQETWEGLWMLRVFDFCKVFKIHELFL